MAQYDEEDDDEKESSEESGTKSAADSSGDDGIRTMSATSAPAANQRGGGMTQRGAFGHGGWQPGGIAGGEGQGGHMQRPDWGAIMQRFQQRFQQRMPPWLQGGMQGRGMPQQGGPQGAPPQGAPAQGAPPPQGGQMMQPPWLQQQLAAAAQRFMPQQQAPQGAPPAQGPATSGFAAPGVGQPGGILPPWMQQQQRGRMY